MANDEYAKLAGVRSWRPGLEHKTAPAPTHIQPKFDPRKSSLPQEARVIAGMQGNPRTSGWSLAEARKLPLEEAETSPEAKAMVSTVIDILPKGSSYIGPKTVDGQEQHWFSTGEAYLNFLQKKGIYKTDAPEAHKAFFGKYLAKLKSSLKDGYQAVVRGDRVAVVREVKS